MKKLVLVLFIFCSVFASAQISIPQVTGLPAALNSKVDKIAGKSLVADTLSAKIQPHVTNFSNPHTVTKAQVGLGNADNTSDANKPVSTATQTALNTKQDALVSGTNIRTVNGNSVLGSGDIQIVAGGGGAPTNIYLSNVASSISGYKNASPTIDPTETVKTITATPANTITWGEKYLYIAPVATTIIPSGFWELHAYGHVSTATGVSNLVFRIIRYSGSTETFLGTITSFEVNNTTDGEILANGSLNDITVLAGDYLGIQVGFLSDGTTPTRTLTYTIGNGHATHFNTPLPTRHSSLRDKNGEVDFQHLTAAQVAKVDATSGINTGDETLTSIKTKLGAASAVSDGYLKYQDFTLLHTPTTVTTSNGLSISGQNISLQNASTAQSGALTFNDWNTFNSKEPAITKNTAFNKNFGTTPGTVLEGRTFGTAANSAVSDFIQNQNSSSQSANMWISGYAKFGDGSVSGGKMVNYSYNGSGILFNNSQTSNANVRNFSIQSDNNAYGDLAIKVSSTQGGIPDLNLLLFGNDKSATFSSTINSTGFLLNGNNLTSSLSTNYLPKWNGSSFVSSLISDDGEYNYLGGNRFSRLIGGNIRALYTGGNGLYVTNNVNTTDLLNLSETGILRILSSTQSTSPTTGALVVNGGIGADHVRANNFYGSGANLTGVQLPITLTTNGTSGAATFSGNVLNIPNYTSSGTGGSFTSTYTDISNTTLTTATLANYTNVNGVISASVIGTVTSTATGKCVFRVSLPTITNSSRSIVISGTDSGSTTATNCFVNGDGTNYVEIAFIAATSSSQFKFKLISMGI